MARIFITGSAGFIGFHLAQLLLDQGHDVFGYDGITAYYDQRLKRTRHAKLQKNPRFQALEAMLEDEAALSRSIARFQPDLLVHLAAQAGVRYSLENPRAYVDANLVGTFNVLEAARKFKISHLMMASTSSVYGANTRMPFQESDATDTQLTLYAATKKAGESMAHSYAHLWGVPTTVFRFFSVYGSWGRPDMALFKFTEAILNNRAIDLYNNGDMQRDFTYVADLVKAISLLMDCPPDSTNSAPYQIVNIGNSRPVSLLDFVAELERALCKTAVRNLMPMQPGDVAATWADVSTLRRLTGFVPDTSIKAGIAAFVDWYLEYYGAPLARTGT